MPTASERGNAFGQFQMCTVLYNDMMATFCGACIVEAVHGISFLFFGGRIVGIVSRETVFITLQQDADIFLLG